MIRACLFLLPAVLAGCDRGVQESELPPSLAGQNLAEAEEADLAGYLRRWHPRDWRAALAQALASEESQARRDFWEQALRLGPTQPLLYYAAALESLADSARGDSVALALLEEALVLDPANGILDLTRCTLLARLGRHSEARNLFRETRGFPEGDLYGRDLELALLGILEKGLRLNPYDLLEAQAWYRNMPRLPLELWSQALETVFLDPLPERPYDIRRRGREAALGLYRLGKSLERASLNPDRVFSDGREERLAALLFQAKAAEFLGHYARVFDPRPPRLLNDSWNPSPSRVSLPPDWEGFFSAWERLESEGAGITMAEAAEAMRRQPLWRKVLRQRLPAGE